VASRWIPRITSPGGGGQGPPGPPGPDHFAPKYLVGNVPAGDDPVAFSLNGFEYIPDPGDGTGIAFALTQPNGPGDVWIRPGTYDLGAGPVVAPLVIPAGVRVQGAGFTTNLVARAAGNQGVFAVGASASLRDLTIDAAASPASLGSDAVVLVAQGASLRDLSIQFATDPAGQLREGIRFVAPPLIPPPYRVTDLLNVRVTTTTTTGAASPTRCLNLLPNAFVGSRDVSLDGGDIGIDLDGGIFVGYLVLISRWSLFGIRHISGAGGAVRIDEALVAAAAGSTGIGVQLASGGHVLRSVSIQGSGVGNIGLYLFDATSTISSIEIDDIQVFGFDTCVQMGDVAPVQDVSVVNSFFSGGRFGIVLLNSASDTCHLKGNTIRTSVPQGSSGRSIWTQGAQHEIEGNHILHLNGNMNDSAVVLESSRTTFKGNTVAFSDDLGITVQGTRVVLNGNEITADASVSRSVQVDAGNNHVTVVGNTISQPNTNDVIRVDSNLNVVSSNSIEKTQAAPNVAGILLAGDNNTCIGNVVEGASGGAVTDSGVGNDIAHNVGV